MNILFVDDDPISRDLVRVALEAVPGFEVKTRNNAEDTLRSVGAFRPDVILLDVAMPGAGGFELAVRLRESGALGGVPIIFLTARARQFQPGDFRAAGAIGVIAKPIDPATLPSQIRGLVAAAA